MSSMGGQNDQPAPGWYPDPKAEAPYRYWSGSGWTEQVADSPGQASAPAPAAEAAPPPPSGAPPPPPGAAPPPPPGAAPPPPGGQVGAPSPEPDVADRSPRPAVLAGGVGVLVGVVTIPVVIGIFILLGIGLVYRRTYKPPWKGASVLGQTAKLMGRDVKKRVDYGASAAGRISAPANAATPPPPKSEADSFVAIAILKGVAWFLACATWFPVRDAIAEFRWSKGEAERPAI